MRSFTLPLALAGLLGSAALTAAPAAAYPNAYPHYNHGSYGPPPGRSYAPRPRLLNSYSYRAPYSDPIAAEPVPYEPVPPKRCNVGTVLTGAAIGGGLGAVLANNSRNRLWSLPMGAAMGGILGGVISGC